MRDYLDKINALVAEHVLGWVDVAYVVGGYGDGRNNTEEGPWYEWQGRLEQKEWALRERIPSFSTRIDLAWQVVEKLVEGGLRVDLMTAPYGQYCAWIDGPELEGNYLAGEIVAESMPLAICLAALIALRVKLPARYSGIQATPDTQQTKEDKACGGK